MLRAFGLPALLVLLTLFAGCQPRGPATFPVQGRIMLDGEPLAAGDILLAPHDPQLAPVGGSIVAGHYTLHAQPGTYRVEITASRVIGESEWGMGQVAANFLPAKYNQESELTAEVAAQPHNQFNFQLTLSDSP